MTIAIDKCSENQQAKIKAMKKTISLLTIFFYCSVIMSQTAGTLTVTTTTSSAGGNYSPRNVVAIWIEDEQGNFVKTLMAYAEARITHLNNWESSTSAAGSIYNVVDAITGATRNNHEVRTSTWNGTDINGQIVADGIYRVQMELTDKNSTGNNSSFVFTKGGDPENLTPSNVPSFSNISIVWDPSTVSLDDIGYESNYTISPNPSKGVLNIKGEGIIDIQVWASSGELIKVSNHKIIDLSDFPRGIYYVKIRTDKGSVFKKVILYS